MITTIRYGERIRLHDVLPIDKLYEPYDGYRKDKENYELKAILPYILETVLTTLDLGANSVLNTVLIPLNLFRMVFKLPKKVLQHKGYKRLRTALELDKPFFNRVFQYVRAWFNPVFWGYTAKLYQDIATALRPENIVRQAKRVFQFFKPNKNVDSVTIKKVTDHAGSFTVTG